MPGVYAVRGLAVYRHCRHSDIGPCVPVCHQLHQHPVPDRAQDHIHRSSVPGMHRVPGQPGVRYAVLKPGGRRVRALPVPKRCHLRPVPARRPHVPVCPGVHRRLLHGSHRCVSFFTLRLWWHVYVVGSGPIYLPVPQRCHGPDLQPAGPLRQPVPGLVPGDRPSHRPLPTGRPVR